MALLDLVLISKVEVIQVKELVLQERRIENPHKEGEFEKRVNNIILDPIS